MEKELREKVETLCKGKVICIMKFGSHLYGTDTPESDTDYKAVYIPTIEDVILGKVPKTSLNTSSGEANSKNTKDDWDIECFTLKGFLNMCKQGQVVSLDMLFAPGDMMIYQTGEWDELITNRNKLLHKEVTAFIGYCRKQTAKYGIKGSRLDALQDVIDTLHAYTSVTRLHATEYLLKEAIQRHPEYISIKTQDVETRNIGGGGIKNPHAHTYLEVCGKKYMYTSKVIDVTRNIQKIHDSYGERARQAQKDEGVDYKAVSHALRVCYQAIELLQTGHITMPLKNAEFIRDVKMGKIKYVELAEQLEELMDEVRHQEKVSTLQEKCDEDWIDSKCVQWYTQKG